MTHKYATSDGQLNPADVRARAVGNAVFLEHVGGCGDIFAWGARDKGAAEAIAGELNAVLNGLRSALADAAGKAGHYAHEMRKKLEAVEAELAAWKDLAATASETLHNPADMRPDLIGTGEAGLWRLTQDVGSMLCRGPGVKS